MKTLFLVRHAKATHDTIWKNDWERPLVEEGVIRSHKIASKLFKKNNVPDRIISSPAFRALNTALIFASELNYPITGIEINMNIYKKSASSIVKMLGGQDDKCSSIMVVGHNPSLSELLNFLSKKNNDDLATSETACIQLGIEKWDKIESVTGKLIVIESY
jgi:phosphohistidine phosphatase